MKTQKPKDKNSGKDLIDLELCQDELRRVGGDALMSIVCDIRDTQTGMMRRLDAMEAQHASMNTALSNALSAFPSGDFEGHRRYHETMIELLAEKRRLRHAVQEKTISGLVWAIIVAVGLACWHELQRRLIGR